jgi:hypothetical protein
MQKAAVATKPAAGAPFGAGPEYYFDCVEMVHYGLIPILDRHSILSRLLSELQEKLENGGGDPMLRKDEH